MKPRFLLISLTKESAWEKFLSEALAALGSIEVVSEEQAYQELQEHPYALVLIDVAAVIQADQLVKQLRTRQPGLKIIVITLSSIWQEARSVLRAGAVDYLSRSLTNKEFLSAVQEALKMSPPFTDTKQTEIQKTPKTTILFVDNDVDFLATRREFLEQEGYVVLVAHNEEAARRALTLGDVRLAIFDLRLEDDDDEKDFSGLATAQKIAPFQIPTIILTGYASPEAVRETLKPSTNDPHPPMDFIAKHEGPKALLDAVNRLLNHPNET